MLTDQKKSWDLQPGERCAVNAGRYQHFRCPVGVIETFDHLVKGSQFRVLAPEVSAERTFQQVLWETSLGDDGRDCIVGDTRQGIRKHQPVNTP